MLHKPARLRARQERGSCNVLTESQTFGQRRPGGGPPDCHSEATKELPYNMVRQFDNVKSCVQKLELTCTEVSLQRSFSFVYSVIMEYY